MKDSPSAASLNRPDAPAWATWLFLILVFLAVHFAALFSPALLDDADATHANGAVHIAESGDWVTIKVNGVRYLEKAPLPYWLAAADYKIFGENVFATHLPLSLAVLGCAMVGWAWARRAYGQRAAFYAALGMLTSVGVFLFTRINIPEAELTFFLSFALYSFLTGLESDRSGRIYAAWVSLALALLTKGLIAPVFFFAAVIPFLFFTGLWRRWRVLHIFSGGLLFLAIAAPWHILAGLRNPDYGNPVGNVPTPGHVHGFFYFYFINEHILRFLGSRYPHDYSKLPALLYWALHIVWLFPWSLFFPAAILWVWRTRHSWLENLRPYPAQTVDLYIENALEDDPATYVSRLKFRTRTTWLLTLYAAIILVFFAISTNQEYYTWPAYFPLIVLTAGALANLENSVPTRWLTIAHAVFTVAGLAASGALLWGLWQSRGLPFVDDIGTLLVRRNVAGYSLSMAHFFDLTGPSFAALRLPAALAAVALLVGPAFGWVLRAKKKHVGASVSVAVTTAVFLIAAHIAFGRFSPMLSSKLIADTINVHASPSDALYLYGDQADGSSVIFYTHEKLKKDAYLVHGRSTSMIWGSCYPDAPPIFLEDPDLTAQWGTGSRKWLFVPSDWREHVSGLLGSKLVLVQELSGKALFTDRPIGR